MPLNATATESLLPKLLHDFAQPVTALVCSMEITLARPCADKQYLAASESWFAIVTEMAARVNSAHALAEAAASCSRSHGVRVAEELAEVKNGLGGLAESLDATIEVNCEDRLIYGNAEKLRMAFTHMFDYLLSGGGGGLILILDRSEMLGDVRIRQSGTTGELFQRQALEIAQTALPSMGAGLESAGKANWWNIHLSSFGPCVQ